MSKRHNWVCGGGSISEKVVDCRQSGAAVGMTWWEIAGLTLIQDWDPCVQLSLILYQHCIKTAGTAIG
jgi:hypothetical protein